MNKHVILMGAAAALLLSCAREADFAEIQPGETITFTAGWADAETRTILQPDGTSVWWEPAAQVNMFFGDKASAKFTSSNGQPQAIVDFLGSLPISVGSVETENPPHAYWAVYPYNAANTCDGESMTLTVPATQTAAAGTFDNKMFPSIATSTNFYLAFYNVCGGVRFTVYNEGILSVSFKANNGEPLAGKVQVGFDGVPVVKNVIEGTDEVTVNAPDGGFVPGTYYFAALLPQTLTKGMSLTFRNSDGKVATTSLENSITVNRSRFGKLDEKDKDLTFVDDGSSHDPTDAIVFADPKVKEKLVAAFDTNSDGVLSYAEAAAVTSGADVKAAFGAIKTYKSFNEFQYFTGVTTIPDYMFENWSLVTCISLPSGLTTIGRFSFKNCKSLDAIIIPETVSSIGAYAFSNCSSLTSMFLPRRISIINEGLFSGCSNLSSIVYSDSVSNICMAAFEGCSSLLSVSLPESMTQIGTRMFMDCSSLTSIFIPESVTYIGDSAFSGCSELASVLIPDGVISIGSCAFFGCSSLSSIVVPDGVKDISGSLFENCSNISYVKIPEDVSYIGESAFSGCSNLSSIQIPETVTTIGNYAFKNCSSLTSVEIPESVLLINEGTFSGCKALASVVIPESVTSIGKYAFKDCRALHEITIPDTVTSIGVSAFSTSGLTSIIIPDGITTIESQTFYTCDQLTSITLPDSITSIGMGAFHQCYALSSVIIPRNVTRINQNAFFHCDALSSVYVLAINPPQGSTDMFPRQDSCIIYVPSESLDAYKAAYYWKTYANRIQAMAD